jgi:hypothetical protein
MVERKIIMLKCNRMLFVLFAAVAAGFLMAISSVTVNAQANPSESETNQWRQRGPCRDPWVSKAVSEYEGRTPRGIGDFQECSPALYANGHWNSYAELYRGVTVALGGLDGHGISFAIDRPVNSTVTLKTLSDGIVVGKGTVKILTNNGRTLINENRDCCWLTSSEGAGIVSHDGGTLIVGERQILSLGDVAKKVSLGGGKYFVVRK